MARTVETIQQFLIATLVTAGAMVGEVIVPAEWSDYDYRQLLTFVVAVAQSSLEQLWDSFKEDIEAKIGSAAPLTAKWIKKQMLLFQYSATDPQIVQLDETTGALYYPTVNTSYQIIKYCSVVKGGLGRVLVKVAGQASGAPVVLDSSQLAAAQAHIDLIGTPGITYQAFSGASDKLYVKARIYFNGLYEAVIRPSVRAAIVAYMNSIDFDGRLYLSKLEDIIQAVPGVTDVVLIDVIARADTTPYGSGTPLMYEQTEISRFWNTVSGYIIPEDTAGHTLVDTLIFEAEA